MSIVPKPEDVDWQAYDTQDDALASVLPGMQPGDVLTVHDPACASDDGGGCDCDVIVVRGPSYDA